MVFDGSSLLVDAVRSVLLSCMERKSLYRRRRRKMMHHMFRIWMAMVVVMVVTLAVVGSVSGESAGCTSRYARRLSQRGIDMPYNSSYFAKPVGENPPQQVYRDCTVSAPLSFSEWSVFWGIRVNRSVRQRKGSALVPVIQNWATRNNPHA